MTDQRERVDRGEDGTYVVVINHPEGLDKEHAELLKRRLVADGFHEHVVTVLSRNTGGDREDGD